MKVWAVGKRGVEGVRESLREHGLRLSDVEPEVVVAWGGDGSILRASRLYPHSCLLGLREKSLGRLAEIDGVYRDYAIEMLAREEFRVEEAPRVELTCKGLSLHGLNEVYFHREYEGAARFRILVAGGSPYDGVLFGDGCLVATPLGSTAYSWTSGRRIVLHPQESALVLTPLSSGHLDKMIQVNGVSVVKPAEQIRVPDDREITVEIIRGGRSKLSADGLEDFKTYVDLEKGDEVVFRKSQEKTRFIRLPDQNH